MPTSHTKPLLFDYSGLPSAWHDNHKKLRKNERFQHVTLFVIVLNAFWTGFFVGFVVKDGPTIKMLMDGMDRGCCF